MKRLSLYLLILLVFPFLNLQAQNGASPVSYTNLALQFSDLNDNGDPASAVLPSVAIANGYGGFMDNPATIGLLNRSYLNVGLLHNSIEEEDNYLNTSISESKNNRRFSNLSAVYKLPTERGSFVVGGGYNLHSNMNRFSRVNARNNQSTITDQFKDIESDYNEIAFNAYAIDYANPQQTSYESIFRADFQPGQYQGISQNVDVSQKGRIGEFSFVLGTEFQKNLYLGISAGIVSGQQSYRRNFLESDNANNYTGGLNPADDPGADTNIDNILTYDEVDSRLYGISLRAGLVYSLFSKINIGASLLFPSNLIVQEEYYSSIETTLDDGSESFFSDFAGEFEYAVRRPGELGVGLGVDNIGPFKFSVAAQFVDYTQTEVDLTRDSDLDFQQVAALRDQESSLDSLVAADYKLVAKIKGGVKYSLNRDIELRAGYAFLPGKSKVYSADRNVFSGGFGYKITDELILDLSAQYSTWNDRSVLYTYQNEVGGEFRSESITERVNSLNILAGLRILF